MLGAGAAQGITAALSGEVPTAAPGPPTAAATAGAAAFTAAGAGAGAAAGAAARPSSRLTLLDLGCNDEIVSSPELTARLRDAWKKVGLVLTLP